MSYTMRAVTASTGDKQWTWNSYPKNGAMYGRKGNYKVVEHHRFSTKIHLMGVNTKNRILRTHISLFAISETVTSQNMDEKRNIIFRTKMTLENFFLWGYLKQQVYTISSPKLQGLRRRIAVACARVTRKILKNVEQEILTKIRMYIIPDGEQFELPK
ncbi:hypothetical protein AVEN_131971-1 [Araneus ventricosus]|uniref:Uncharacterized protein n=1 Tax=Araneus ventricosus TaxID=182803 RepID=A0A4Y2B2M0_ARAVE|nr:hypothetical protein AVEN_131971-1 [Araneus ventricosus]